MKMPIIGVVARRNQNQWVINQNYMDALIKANAIPFLIVPQPKASLVALIDCCDGILIPGGGDIDPSYYSQSNSASIHIDQEIDQLDFDVLQLAQQKQIFVLGICRGLQAINVYLKGSLIQDIATLTQSTIDHSSSSTLNQPYHGHTIQTLPNSLCAQICVNEIEVNSYHHQAIQTLSPFLIATAWSKDGIIEAVEGQGFFAVQWHPERMTQIDVFQNLFDTFVKKCQ